MNTVRAYYFGESESMNNIEHKHKYKCQRCGEVFTLTSKMKQYCCAWGGCNGTAIYVGKVKVNIPKLSRYFPSKSPTATFEKD